MRHEFYSRDELEHVAQISAAQHKRNLSYTTTHTTSVVAPGVILYDLHLPEETAIASAWIENPSTVANLLIYEGSGGTGRIIATVAPGKARRLVVADHISSLSVVADAADPAMTPEHPIIITLSTHKWSPNVGTL